MTRRIKFETKDAPGEVTLEDVQKAIEAHAKATGETITKLTDELAETKANLLELEQKSPDTRLPGHFSTARDLASTLVENEFVQQIAAKSRRDGGQIAVKAADLLGLEVKNTITDNDSSFHNVSASPNGPFGGLERTRFIYDVLPKIPVTTGHVAVTRELSFTNNAAVTLDGGSPAVYAEGVAKAESSLTFENDDLRLPVIAHFLKASNQILADAPRLRQMIDSRLRYGLKVKIDASIVSELTTSGNYTAFTPSSGDDGIASVSRALALLESSDSMGTLILLNPSTWRSIQRLRADGGDGQHLIGNPQQVTGERLWGVPVMPTNAMTAGKLIVADFATAGEYYVRQDAVIDMGFVNDDFTKNLVTIRCEARGAWHTIRPVSVAYGDLTL